MEKKMKQIIQNIDSSQFFGILFSIFVVLFSFVIFFLWKQRKSVGRNILLTGLNDAGKTVLYTHLVQAKCDKTYSSIKENVGKVQIKDRTVQIVDIPGHERLRYQFIDKYKSSMRGLIYMIDSATVQKEIRDVAEFLYNLLCVAINKKNMSVLILCNKQDLMLAKGSNVIETMLEKELNLVHSTKASQLEATDTSSETGYFLGKQEKYFKFSDLNLKIEFAECSSLQKDSESPVDILRLQNWLAKVS